MELLYPEPLVEDFFKNETDNFVRKIRTIHKLKKRINCWLV